MRYVGLTDDPSKQKEEHGNPSDWGHRHFSSETEARLWAKAMVSQPDCTGDIDSAGLRYGYTYTITPATMQQS